MDQSNRRKINISRRINSHKYVKEVNGNNTSGSGYKVENTRRLKSKRDNYKSDEQNHDRMADNLPNYVPLHGQRLFPAMSDPAVCGYPVSLGYPYDPIPVPVGYPIYHPAPYTQHFSYKDTRHSPIRSRRNNYEKSDQLKDSFQTVDEYTSLPPGNLPDIESDHQRRFSDPGLANNSGSEEDSLSNKGSSDSWFEEGNVAAQIESLILENKRLAKELKETQAELNELKLEVASITQIQSSFEPGVISELVREVREATKIQEETLLARLCVFSDNYRKSFTSSSLSMNGIKECSVECEETKTQLAKAKLEEEELSSRLTKLEEQMKTILAHNSINVASKGEQFELQTEKKQLEQELKTAIDARNIAEANSTKFERIINCITKKLPNGLVLEEKSMLSLPSASSETSESLSSSLGSNSLHSHSPQVTMSGPVTDL